MENKKKNVILMLSKVFPAKHISAGTKTYFEDKINRGVKIHTIRSNFEMWRHNIEKINNKDFVLSLRQWRDKPYKSKQVEIKELAEVGYERITLHYIPDTNEVKAVINGKRFLDVKKIAENDGLEWNDFIDWFFGQGTNRTLFQGVIIHFTDYRYNNFIQ